MIINNIFDAGDDAICIKSGKDEDGRKRGEPCQNVIVKNNTVLHGHGGFVVGSEMSGGVRNVYVADCTFIGTDVGLRFKSTARPWWCGWKMNLRGQYQYDKHSG